MLKDKQRLLVAEKTLTLSVNTVPKLLARVYEIMKRIGIKPTEDVLKKQIAHLKHDITILSSKTFLPYKVYITFNSEHNRKDCIYDTAVSERTVWRNSIGKNASSVLDGFVLKVKQSQEPGDVIYEYTDAGVVKRLSCLGASYTLTAALLVGSYLIINWLAGWTSDIPVAAAISFINVGMPQAVIFITFLCEIHESEIDIQKSILFKLLSARCVNSAFLIYFSTPYRETFGLENLERIQNILLADAITTPIFRLINPVDLGMRYVMAPLMSQTQAQYNKFWLGAKWNLAERYSDVLKSVFIGCFFAPLVPSGLFITTFAIIMTYLVDKFSLYHLWRNIPTMGPDLAYLARYFYFVTVLCHLHITLIYFANWPFRGVYETDNADRAECRFLRCMLSDDMTDDQKKIVNVYSLCTIIAFAVILFWGVPYRVFKFLKRVYYPYRKDRSGDASDITFRSLVGLNAYIPVVQRNAYLTPYIVSHIANIPKRFIPVHSGLKWDELPDPKEFSVFNKSDFVHIPDEQLHRAISCVTYYHEEDNDSIIPQSSGEWVSQECTGEFSLEMMPPVGLRPQLKRQKSTRVDISYAEENSLPTGWEKRKNADGEVFYMDNNTDTVHYDRPSLDSSMPKFLSEKSKSFSPNDISVGDLFEDRETIVRVAVTRIQNRNTIDDINVAVAEAVDQEIKGIAVLPPGWEELFTPEGVPYFVNHNDKTTQWNLPKGTKNRASSAVSRNSVVSRSSV